MVGVKFLLIAQIISLKNSFFLKIYHEVVDNKAFTQHRKIYKKYLKTRWV